jgi:two-component system response regulator LytT
MLNAAQHDVLIVFTTAYEDYAVTAFGLNAVDYLLKPYSQDRLKETLRRIRARLNASATGQTAAHAKEPAVLPRKWNKLLLEDGAKHVLLDPETILYAVREDRVIRIYTEEGQCITSKQTLHELEEELQGYSFFRPHRSYLVNINQIEELVPWFNGAYNIIIKDGKRTAIPLSREAARELFRALKGKQPSGK